VQRYVREHAIQYPIAIETTSILGIATAIEQPAIRSAGTSFPPKRFNNSNEKFRAGTV
jgi:hypothetical protein